MPVLDTSGDIRVVGGTYACDAAALEKVAESAVRLLPLGCFGFAATCGGGGGGGGGGGAGLPPHRITMLPK